jgi:mannose-1-phosphate guanylyltransferase
VITHESYKELVHKDIPELSTEQIICEPSRNNTAPSIAYASMKLAGLDPEGLCVVAPADHVIEKAGEFRHVLETAIAHAEENQSLITLGIDPTRPDTGYGYIEFDKKDENPVKKVNSFKEKPDMATAEAYLSSGSYAWNAGIFIWKLSSILSAFEKHASQIFNTLQDGNALYNTSGETEFIKTAYPRTEQLSVDYAILERADNVYTIPCDIGWSDLGTWNSLHDFYKKDDHENAIISGPAYLESTTHSLLLSGTEKLVVIRGLDDFIVIDTPDCLLIYPRKDEQAIKELKEKLRMLGFDAYL